MTALAHGKCIREEQECGGCPCGWDASRRESFASKLDAIEWIRIAAVCGVVWFHIKDGPFKQIGYAGLIVFILISVVFQAAGAEKDLFAKYIRKKSARIIPPWIFWFGFYGLLNSAKGKELFPYSKGVVANVLTGPWVGLWFLPFIFMMSVMVFALAKMSADWNPLGRAAVYLAIGLAMLLDMHYVPKPWLAHAPWGQWMHALPALPIGMGLHGVLKTAGRTRASAMVVFLIMVEIVCITLRNSDPGVAIPYGVAVLVVSAGYLIPSRLPPAVTRLGGLCMGVYLVHSFIMSMLKTLLMAGSAPWSLFAVTVVLSLILVALMRGNRWLAKVI